MTSARAARRRPGTTVLECAFVLPILFFLLLALAVGSTGVFRYQEVSTLAREGARYASTHGYQYRKDGGLPLGTSADWKKDVVDNGVLPKLLMLDADRLTVTVTWPDVINQPGKPDNWPGSRVDVTVAYQWTPSVLWAGPLVLQSTSSMPITN